MTKDPSTPKPNPSRLGRRVALTVACLLLLGVIAEGIRRTRPIKQAFYTDADLIKESDSTALIRDILWQPAAKLADLINTERDEYEPRLSQDGQTLFFVRGKAGENADLYQSRRTHEGWTEPVPLTSINSDYDELGPVPTADGRTLYFYSDRVGGVGGYDLWAAHRQHKDDLNFDEPVNIGPAVNSAFNEYGPAITDEGKTLYFASNRPRPDELDQPQPDGWIATLREDLHHRDYDLYITLFTERGPTQAKALDALNSPFHDGSPAVSPIGDFLYFSSDRAGGLGGFDLYRSRRLNGEHQFATNLGLAINSSANELDPGLTHLGYALYFSSDRPLERLHSEQPNPYDLYESASREVFRQIDTKQQPPINWMALWKQIGPNLLWALLALLLSLLVWLLLRAYGHRRLSLLIRCLLASLLAHLLLLLLFNFWQVGSALADAMQGRGSIQVALITSSGSNAIERQILGELTSVITPPVRAAFAERPSAQLEVQPVRATVDMSVEHQLLRVEEQPLHETQAREAKLPESSPTPTAHSIEPRLDVPQPYLPLPAEAAPAQHAETESTTPQTASAEIPRPNTSTAFSENVARPSQDPLAPECNPLAYALDSTILVKATMPADAATPSLPTANLAASSTLVPISPSAVDIALPTRRLRPSNPEAEAEPAAQPVAVEAKANRPPHAAVSAESSSSVQELAPVKLNHDAFDVVPSTADIEGILDASPIAEAWNPATAVPLDLTVPSETGLSLPNEKSVSSNQAEEQALPVVAAVESAALQRQAVELPRSMDGARSVEVNLMPAENQNQASDLMTQLAFAATPTDSIVDPRRMPLGAFFISTPDITDLPAPLGLRLPTEIEVPPSYANRNPEVRQEILERMGGSNQTENAVALALEWLARHQSEDGHWDGGRFDEGCNGCGGETEYEVDTALTGLALLCFLGADHTHVKDSPYRDNVQRGLDWLVGVQDRDGDLRNGETMYSHGIAAIALSEAFGMTKDARLLAPVEAAVGFIVEARNRRSGGWRYRPGQKGDTSVTGWQVMALVSAQRAGIDLPRAPFRNASMHLDAVSSRRIPGLYAYQPGRQVTLAMTAEAMFIRQLLGADRTENAMSASAGFLVSELPDWNSEPNTYYWYYATLALYQYGGQYWEVWNEALTEQLLEHQADHGAAAGSWAPNDQWAMVGGRVYQTALCTLMLEVYYRYLPLYSNDPPGDMIGGISGAIVDATTGEPLPGAEVRLVLPDRAPISITAGADGRYKLRVPEVPDFFALSASHEGYLPQTQNIDAAMLHGTTLAVDFNLTPASEQLIALEPVPDVHHLGDNAFSGSINSQFQQESEGDRYQESFVLTPRQIPPFYNRCQLRMMVKGVQRRHRIEINGIILDTHLDHSPRDGSFGEFIAPIDDDILHTGDNTITIIASPSDSDIDDFEFVNIQIQLAP